MIDETKIDQSYIQPDKTNYCVLATYAIGANYFCPGLAPHTAFEDYCKHHKLPFTDIKDAQEKYAEHFNKKWKSVPCSGFQLIVEAHNNYPEKFFATSQAAFDAQHQYVLRKKPDDFQALLQQLRDTPSICCISFSVSGGSHNWCVYCGNDGNFYYRAPEDTLPKPWSVSHDFDECLVLTKR